MGLLEYCIGITSRIHKVVIPTIRFPPDAYEELLTETIRTGMTWLDVGCGHQILSAWRFDREKELVARCEKVVGIDADGPSVSKHRSIVEVHVGDAGSLPFEDDSFDLVTANMVVEHFSDPAKVFSEIRRVLKPGGTFLFHTPNVWGHTTIAARCVPNFVKTRLIYLLTRREAEDVFPTYYRVNSRTKIKHLADRHGFEVQRILMIQGHPLALGILVFPVYLLELIWVKLLTIDSLDGLRGNIIAVLKKLENKVTATKSG